MINSPYVTVVNYLCMTLGFWEHLLHFGLIEKKNLGKKKKKNQKKNLV
jgi:hypothetical protein